MTAFTAGDGERVMVVVKERFVVDPRVVVSVVYDDDNRDEDDDDKDEGGSTTS